MFDIHKVRLEQNFMAFNTICKKEKIDFFLMIDVVKLIKNTINDKKDFFDERIELKDENSKKLLERIKKNKGHLLLDFGEDAYVVKPETYYMIKEIYKLQKEEDKKAIEIKKRYIVNVNVSK